MSETVQEILGKANYVYHASQDAEELEESAKKLDELLSQSWLNESNRESAEALCWRIRAKKLALSYFTGGYVAEDCDRLEEFLSGKMSLSREKGYAKTTELFGRLLSFLSEMKKIMSDAAAQAERVRTYGWELASDSVEECEEIASLFETKISSAQALPEGKTLFGEGVSFPDVKGDLLQDLRKVKDFAKDAAVRLRTKKDESFLTECAKEIGKTSRWKMCEFFPELPGGARKLANAVVLCTPFDDEAELYAVKNAADTLYCIEAASFEGRTEESLSNIFALFARKAADAVIFGMERYRGLNKAELLRAAMRFGKAGRRVFLVDPTGERKIYEEALKAAAEGGLSSMDVSFEYLSMPLYREVIELFENSGMIEAKDGDYDFVRKKMPFMGFAGLNEAVSAFAAKKEWREIAVRHSSQNAAAAKKYLDKLPSQTLFIDTDWGDFTEDVVDDTRRAFDYDDIKAVDPRNIRKIMEGRFSIFEKCGLIVRYCTVAGNDSSVWRTLETQVQEERLAEASKLVMRALGIDIVPEVKVLDQLENKGAGGLCCDGGKRILYRKDCVQDYAWTIDCVCHECYHAFQHMAMYGPWRDWFWTELGVTKGRKDEWLVNTGKKYFSNTSTAAYLVQVRECEARAFASDCIRDSDKVWHTVDFD